MPHNPSSLSDSQVLPPLLAFTKPVIYCNSIPKFTREKSDDVIKKNLTNPLLQDHNPADLFSESIFLKNPLTFELPSDGIKEIYLNNVETSNRGDSIFYYLQLLEMSSKKDSNLLTSKVPSAEIRSVIGPV